MIIGIEIAIVSELESFLSGKYELKTIKDNNREVYYTKINNNEIYATKCGFGLIDAAATTQYLITKFNCDAIFNYGVTGALDPALEVEDLFICEKVCNRDYDVSPVDPVKKCQYEEFDDIYIPLDKFFISKVKTLNPEIKSASVCSGDNFIIDLKTKEKLFKELKTNLCDMELCSIARVCFLNHVPCMSIKCISDKFDGDGRDFIKNVTRSSNKAFNLLSLLLDSL